MLFSDYGVISDFDGDISLWNVSHVTNMTEMFYNSSFAHDISGWNVSPRCKIDRIAGKDTSMKIEYFPECIKKQLIREGIFDR